MASIEAMERGGRSCGASTHLESHHVVLYPTPLLSRMGGGRIHSKKDKAKGWGCGLKMLIRPWVVGVGCGPWTVDSGVRGGARGAG